MKRVEMGPAMIVRIAGRVLTWCPEVPPIDLNQFPKSKKFNKEPYSLVEKTRRRFLKWQKLVYSQRSNPKWFITLVYPKSLLPDLSPRRMKSDLDTLGKRIRYKYPDSWFMYVFEWKEVAGFHCHLLGKTGKRKPHLKKFIGKWWKKIVRSPSKNLYDIKKYSFGRNDDTHRAYLTSPIKKYYHGIVAATFGSHYSFGVINGKNLPKNIYKTKIIDQHNFEKVRGYLIKEMLKQWEATEGHNKYHFSQIKKSLFGVHILAPDHDELLELLNAVGSP